MILEEGGVLLDRECSEQLMDFVRKILQIEILAVIGTSLSFSLSKLVLSQIRKIIQNKTRRSIYLSLICSHLKSLKKHNTATWPMRREY